jgi:APA family basic amino acid/polyamine antiporter
MTSESGVFVRKASGLVRQLAPQDSFYMNVIGVAAAVSIVTLLYAAPTTYPGADLYIALTLGLIIAIPFGWTYAMLSTAFPRSGGDYVYISRIIHPSAGLASSGLYLLANLIGVGQFPMFTAWYVSSLLGIAGALYGNATYTGWGAWVGTPEGTIVVAGIIIIWSAIINLIGVRFLALVQRIYFAIAAIGTIALFGLMSFTGYQVFVGNFNAYAAGFGTSYQDIINKATSLGFAPAGFSWAVTILATVFLFGYLTTAWPIMVAGEVKRPARSMILGCVVGIFASWLIYMITTALFYNSFGKGFTDAASWLSATNPSDYPLPVGPYLTYLMGFLSQNAALLGLIGIAFVCWGASLTPNHIMICSRPMFAYAMDRVFPSKFASVNERTHTPAFSIVVTTIVGLATLILTAYAGALIALTVNVAVLCTLYFLFTLFTGVVFPFVKKEMFEASPAIVKAKIGPVPVISLAGGFSGIAMVLALGMYLIHPELSGPVSPLSIGLIVGWGVFFALIYYIARAYWQRKGLDIGLSYREIPPG